MATELQNELQAFERFLGQNGKSYASLEEALTAFRTMQRSLVAAPPGHSTYTCPPRTELGKRLRELRGEIVASGERLLDESALDKEVQERKGGNDADTFS